MIFRIPSIFCRMIATDKTAGIYKIFAKDRYHALMMPCLSCDLQVGPILNDRIVNNQASTYGSINLTCLTPKIWLFFKHIIINLQEIVLKHICPTDSLTRPKPSGLGIYQALITASWALIAVTLSVIFSCDQAALWMVQSVRPSVRLSVRHTFLTRFLSTYHHGIFRSYYQWQKWRPCKRSRSEVKGQGHRGHDPT